MTTQWDRTPPPLRAVVWVLVVGVALGVVAGVNLAARAVNPGVGQVVSLLALIAVVVVGSRWNRRRLGGREQVVLFRQALRDGELPPKADATRWRRPVAQAADTSVLPWVFVVMAVVAMVVLGVNGVINDFPVRVLVALPVSLVPLAVGYPLVVLVRRPMVRNARRLLDALDRRTE